MNSQIEDLKSFSRYLDAVNNQGAVGLETKLSVDDKRVEILEIPMGEIVGNLLSVTFGMVALKAGEHWNLSKEEEELAGEAYGAVIDKYFPDIMGAMGAEITALMVTAMLITPRLTAGSSGVESGQRSVEDESARQANVMQMPVKAKGDKNGD